MPAERIDLRFHFRGDTICLGCLMFERTRLFESIVGVARSRQVGDQFHRMTYNETLLDPPWAMVSQTGRTIELSPFWRTY